MNALSHLEARALAAYNRAPIEGNGARTQPGAVETVDHDGLQYIRLANVRGTLAVYRVRTVNGAQVLKGLRRWPQALERA